jgi:hypothetical protein
MDKVKVAGELVKVAQDLVATVDYPMGISDKGKILIDQLNAAQQSKLIYNASFKEIKESLSRRLEEACEPTKDRQLWVVAYVMDFSRVYQFNHLNKAIRNAEKALSYKSLPADDVSKMRQDEAPRIVEDWPKIAERLAEHVKVLKSWALVRDLLEDVKGYIVMGREPSHHVGPEKFMPKASSPEIIQFVGKELRQSIDQLIPKMEVYWFAMFNQEVKSVVGMVNSVLEKVDPALSGWQKANAVFMKLSGDAKKIALNVYKNFRYGEFDLRTDLEGEFKRRAQMEVKQIADAFVSKNISKIAPIVELKGNLHGAKVLSADTTSGFWGEIKFNFEDGTEFTVRNKVVWKYSWSGGSFTQFPTTFHQVKFQDGKVASMLSEEQMHKEWAEKRG